MKILVINAGSSSMKYQLINMEENKLMAKGICEQIGCDNSEFTHTVPGAPEKSLKHVPKTMENHRDALKMIVECIDRRVSRRDSIHVRNQCGRTSGFARR